MLQCGTIGELNLKGVHPLPPPPPPSYANKVSDQAANRRWEVARLPAMGAKKNQVYVGRLGNGLSADLLIDPRGMAF